MKFRNFICMSVVAACFAFSALAQGLPKANQPEGSAQPYPVMSWQEYSSHASEYEKNVPYVLQINTPRGGLLYFGVKHSHDPKDPQFSKMETLWRQFHPEIAFNEGGTPPVEQSKRDEAIEKYGDPGSVRYLAMRDKIQIESNEPKPEDEVKELLKKFSAEKIKTFYILRQIPEYYRMPSPTTSLDKYLEDSFSFYGGFPGLNVPPNSISELAESLVDPAGTGTIFNEISRASTDYRDQFMVGLILRTACEKRVFAVVGWSHVVMQEPAIRELLKKKCS
jgi:hypothetical protein